MRGYDDRWDQPLPGMPADPHPECRAEWHGADGGACPACGWDSHPVPTKTPAPLDDEKDGHGDAG